MPERGVLTADEARWQVAAARAKVIGPLAESGRVSIEAADQATEELGGTQRQVYALVRRWRAGEGWRRNCCRAARPSAVVARGPSLMANHRRRRFFFRFGRQGSCSGLYATRPLWPRFARLGYRWADHPRHHRPTGHGSTYGSRSQRVGAYWRYRSPLAPLAIDRNDLPKCPPTSATSAAASDPNPSRPAILQIVGR